MEKCPRGVPPVEVLLVDEHPVTRWGIMHFLGSQDGIRVVGEAGTYPEALELGRRLRPTIITTELTVSGCEMTARVGELTKATGAAVLAFSTRDTWDAVERFTAAGGAGFLPKRCPPEELIHAVRMVGSGKSYISPSLRRVSRGRMAGRNGNGDALSAREREIAILVTRGLTSRQIADQLCISLKTVETHRYRIFKNLGIGSRAELVGYVLEHGMLAAPKRELEPQV